MAPGVPGKKSDTEQQRPAQAAAACSREHVYVLPRTPVAKKPNEQNKGGAGAAAASPSPKKSTLKVGKNDLPPNPDGKDAYMKSSFVHGLTLDKFQRFLQPRDAVIVMFYTTSDDDIEGYKSRYVKAAQNTKRCNHAYAAVNCALEQDLCQREMVDTFPQFKLYATGHLLTTVRDYKLKMFDSDTMVRYVQDLYTYEKPGERPPCT